MQRVARMKSGNHGLYELNRQSRSSASLNDIVFSITCTGKSYHNSNDHPFTFFCCRESKVVGLADRAFEYEPSEFSSNSLYMYTGYRTCLEEWTSYSCHENLLDLQPIWTKSCAWPMPISMWTSFFFLGTKLLLRQVAQPQMTHFEGEGLPGRVG